MFKDQEKASVTSVLCKDLVTAGIAGKRLLGGVILVFPLRTFPGAEGMKWPWVAALSARVIGLTEQF